MTTRRFDADAVVRVAVINEDTNVMFGEWTERLAECWFGELVYPDDERFVTRDDAIGVDVDMGQMFRAYRDEYGACRSSVYVDGKGGTRKVGWYFVKRDRYEDTGERYLRGAWVMFD